jgi:hypothetical protein
MALTIEQMELLHAWVDGETTTAETELAAQLVQRDQAARIYTDELKRLKSLILTHAGVPAPDGLYERVCAALKNEFAAPLIRLPRHSWRLAIAAAAAVLVVSLAFVYSPGGTTTDQPAASDIADRSSDPADSRTQTGPGRDVDAGLGGGESHEQSTKEGKNSGPEENSESPKGNTPPPESSSPAIKPEPGSTRQADESRSVLSLDRGIDQPFELSVNMNRNRQASVLQVYNDVLIVSSMYGAASITDNESIEEARVENAEAAVVNAEEDFAGTDFSNFDCVEVELDAEQVPQLLAALARLTLEQDYGDVIVPADLRKSIKTTSDAVDELQDISRELEELERKPAPARDAAGRSQGLGGVRAYFPPDLQRDCVNNEADALADKDKPGKLEKRLERIALGEPVKGTNESLDDQEAQLAQQRKVKLVIRLR